MVASATLVFLVCAAVAGQESKVPSSEINPLVSHTVPDGGIANNSDAIYVHDKLMQVGVVDGGTPVLRFVECRHYPREHMKLAQVGLTSAGTAVMRLIAGDRCQFAPDAPVSDDGVAGGVHPENHHALEYQRPPFPGLELQRQPVNDRLSIYRRYVCEKFGTACPIALAVQLAENPTGACEIYHYNSADGTLDWGFFQINTVHLTRRGLNLRDLLDCKANIDFAYKLFSEAGFEPWTVYRSGAYLKFLAHRPEEGSTVAANRLSIGNHIFRTSVDLF
ncbi:MAG TPA: hypothetical protein VKB88_03440 [Bryobacteraceae bacterium]|nr:hypothetical protein [Bryobacteraceae bacterium]